MERQYEEREFEYRGEKYKVKTILYNNSNLTYTTTESDMEWWKDLRNQYINRHPKVLEDFIRNFPESQVKEISTGYWISSWPSEDKVSGIGKTKEEAIRNLYLCLSI